MAQKNKLTAYFHRETVAVAVEVSESARNKSGIVPSLF